MTGNGCYDGHRFYPLNRVVKPYPSCIWKYAPKRRSPNTYLHGPASLLSSKAIIYPCNGTVCRIVCPCLVCSGQLSKCDHVMEIHDYFEDHKMHHHAPHTRCIFCSQLFESFPQYSYKRTINIGGFACRKEYISLDSYCFTHVYEIDPNEKIETLKCDQCDKVYKKMSDKKRHFFQVHYEEKFVCPVCHKEFTREDHMERHKQLVHEQPDPEATCTLCKSTFSVYSNFKRHTKTVLDEDGNFKNSCIDCKENFCTLAQLQIHRKQVHKRFKCEICKQTYSTKFNLNNHNKKDKLPCDLCELIFCSKGGFWDHKVKSHK